MASWWNGKLMKWQVDEMAIWWNELMKWLVDKLMKCHVDKMAS